MPVSRRGDLSAGQVRSGRAAIIDRARGRGMLEACDTKAAGRRHSLNRANSLFAQVKGKAACPALFGVVRE
jgi:hypothetical protein